MDEQQVADALARLDDVRERQRLRAQFARAGHTEAFARELGAALDNQARKRAREETVMAPARWVARKTGGLVGRALRNLERQAEKQERDKQARG